MKNRTIKILTAKPEDARGIREVQYKTWLTTYPNEKFGVTVDDIKDRLKNALSDEKIKQKEEQIINHGNNQKTLIAKDGDMIVGFCDLIRHEDRNQLQAIYVLLEYQRMGIGRKFWNEAIKFFDSGKDIFVEVVIYNFPTIEFYKKHGFVDTGKRWSDEKFRMKSGSILPEMEMIVKVTKQDTFLRA